MVEDILSFEASNPLTINGVVVLSLPMFGVAPSLLYMTPIFMGDIEIPPLVCVVTSCQNLDLVIKKVTWIEPRKIHNHMQYKVKKKK